MRRSAFTAEPLLPGGRRRQAGVTLVELMVAIAVALILSLSILGVLVFSASSNKNSTSLGSLNNNIRGVLTLLTRDANSAGFMLGAAQSQCGLTLLYDSSLSTQTPNVYPAWAASQAHGGGLPFSSSTTSYPPSGWNNSTQVLLFAASPSVPDYTTTGASPNALLPGPVATAAYGSAWKNTMTSGTLQLINTSGMTQGDMGMLQVPMNNNQLVCMRVPLSAVTSGTVTGTPGTRYMPTNGFSDFASLITASSKSYGTLGVGQLQHARLLDMGQSASSMQIVEYWIDDSNGYPVLMRSEYSALTDNLIETDALAPGVVSLQALFGTIPVGSAIGGTVPQYKSWGDVDPTTDQVVSVALALVSRTLYDDSGYTAPSTITVPQPASGTNLVDSFSNYKVSTAEQHRHFQVNTLVVSLRNSTWD